MHQSLNYVSSKLNKGMKSNDGYINPMVRYSGNEGSIRSHKISEV